MREALAEPQPRKSEVSSGQRRLGPVEALGSQNEGRQGGRSRKRSWWAELMGKAGHLRSQRQGRCGGAYGCSGRPRCEKGWVVGGSYLLVRFVISPFLSRWLTAPCSSSLPSIAPKGVVCMWWVFVSILDPASSSFITHLWSYPFLLKNSICTCLLICISVAFTCRPNSEKWLWAA